jgi:predicted O-linked N-acetylglucosamine transferase (SPINDLY family)
MPAMTTTHHQASRPASGPLGDNRMFQDAGTQAGRQALDRQDWPAVQRFCHQRLRRSAKDHFGHRYLGTALMILARPKEAREAFEAALSHFPNDPVVLINYADMLIADMDYDRAYSLTKLATVAAPHLLKGWMNLMHTCYLLGRHQEAIGIGQDLLKQALEPVARQIVLNNLSINLRDLGRMNEALEAVREAITLNPAWLPPYMNQLLFMLSMPDASATQMRQVADQYAVYAEGPHRAHWPAFNDRDADPHRLLRVGFLSPDFNTHSVMYFLEGLLPQLDRRQFKVVALYLQSAEHYATQRVRRHCDEFHQLHGLDDATLAQQLQALNIDILIDLAGHTAASGLGAMARKPAPVQVTWLGFPGTTGLTAIDWRITDGISDLPGAEAEYSEKLWRLPDIFCVYRPMSRFPLYRYQPAYRVQPTPALANGYITFGSCNNLSKLTDEVLITWGQVLAAVPGSRLLVEGKGLEDAQACQEFQARCAELGIDPDRLELLARDSKNQYLTYHRMDIALDSFPLTGGTTTFDLLWMGLPVVTMQGDSFRSRMGITMLHGLGETGWIADTAADYVRIAKELAQDVAGLDSRRLQQRRRMERSPLMDEARFTREFGHALRQMWYRWCAKRQPGLDSAGIETLLSTWDQHQWPAQPPQVTIGPGRVISIHEAHAQLQSLTEAALRQAPREQLLAGCTEPPEITHQAWLSVLQWCEYLLDAIPNEPLALATLAEIEHAHGRTGYASTYLHYAQEALAG